MKKWLDSLFDALFPRQCMVCGRRLSISESFLCISCFRALPVMRHITEPLNKTEQLLFNVPAVISAFSYFRYQKESNYRHLLFHLKYYNHPEVGRFLARCAANSLISQGFFSGIDLIVPVPLSTKKKRKRGYNQCDYLALGIADATGISIQRDSITRTVSNSSQTKKSRFQRWENAEGLFQINSPSKLQGKHILLVDDVITTGATISSLAQTISDSVPVRISVFTLALSE